MILKNRNKLKAIVLTLALIGLVSQAAAQEVYIEDYTAKNTVEVPIYLSNITNFGTATINLHYNNSVVKINDISNGDIPSSTLYSNIDNPNSTAKMVAYTSEKPGPSGGFIYAKMSIEAVGNTKSHLNMSIEEFVDSSANPISVNVVNGSLTSGSTTTQTGGEEEGAEGGTSSGSTTVKTTTRNPEKTPTKKETTNVDQTPKETTKIEETTSTMKPTEKSTTLTPKHTPEKETTMKVTPTPSGETSPGFALISAIAGILIIAYMLRR